jgi:hypothetical protein
MIFLTVMDQRDWIYFKNHKYEEDYIGHIMRRLFSSMCTCPSRSAANTACASGSTCTTTSTASTLIDVGI